MTRLAVAGVSLAMMLAPGVAMAQFDSRVGAPPIVAQPMVGRGVRIDTPPMMPRAGQAMPSRVPMSTSAPVGRADRWSNVPGGWQAYRRPTYGYTLPSYWTSAPFYISNWSTYGLSRPANGFGWSRYYDDVVLTDQYGRVYDTRSDVDWSRDARWSDEDYSDSYGYREERYDTQRSDRNRNSDRLAGAAIGAVVGGVAGNVIAGSGDRLAGTLIGGGVGAIAGAAIGDASGKSRRRERLPAYDEGYQGQYEARPTAKPKGKYRYDGRWTGSWNNGPVQTYDGRFDGNVRTHWVHGGGQAPVYRSGEADYRTYENSGYSYDSGSTVTTVIVQPSAPVVTRTVSYVTEYVRVPVKRRVVKRAWKPRVVCGCGS